MRVPLRFRQLDFQQIIFRLWLTITGTGPVNLSLSIYNISWQARPLFKSFTANCRNILRPVPQPIKTQLSRVRREHFIRFIVLDGKAYWSKDNQMFECQVEDGKIDNSKAQPLDAHSLTDRQMTQLLSFLDSTT